jgi:hypothetical protein
MQNPMIGWSLHNWDHWNKNKVIVLQNRNQGKNQMQDNAYRKTFQVMRNIKHMRIHEVLTPPKGCPVEHAKYDDYDILTAFHVKQTTRSVTRNNTTIKRRCKCKRKNRWISVGKFGIRNLEGWSEVSGWPWGKGYQKIRKGLSKWLI